MIATGTVLFQWLTAPTTAVLNIAQDYRSSCLKSVPIHPNSAAQLRQIPYNPNDGGVLGPTRMLDFRACPQNAPRAFPSGLVIGIVVPLSRGTNEQHQAAILEGIDDKPLGGYLRQMFQPKRRLSQNEKMPESWRPPNLTPASQDRVPDLRGYDNLLNYAA